MKKIIIMLAFSLGTNVCAHGSAAGEIKERLDAMSAIGDANKILSSIAKGRTEFQTEVVKTNAEIIFNNTGDSLTELFPEDSLADDSEAKAIIWQNWDKFVGLNTDLNAAALNLSNATSAEEFATLYRQVGGACRSCHKSFRAKK